jgi:hypothetical protein
MRGMTEADDRQAVRDFAAGLAEPLQAEDRADGRTEEARSASLDAMDKVLADLDSGWGEHADYASHHLVRTLDHWGVSAWSAGPLAEAAAQAQQALIRLRPTRP